MAKATNEAPAAKRRFRIKHPTIVNGHIAGIVIKDGAGETDDAIKAHASQEYGCEVTDAATGKPAWPAAGAEDPKANGKK
jgi:hypothetical protein